MHAVLRYNAGRPSIAMMTSYCHRLGVLSAAEACQSIALHVTQAMRPGTSPKRTTAALTGGGGAAHDVPPVLAAAWSAAAAAPLVSALA